MLERVRGTAANWLDQQIPRNRYAMHEQFLWLTVTVVKLVVSVIIATAMVDVGKLTVSVFCCDACVINSGTSGNCTVCHL